VLRLLLPVEQEVSFHSSERLASGSMLAR
jgi:hypothetical protein